MRISTTTMSKPPSEYAPGLGGIKVGYIPPPGEITVVDPNTGGAKGQKLARFSLIPSDWLWQLAEHYGKGANKYAPKNWMRGYAFSLSCDAHDRHYHAWRNGEILDPETGSHHLIAAAWHLIALWWFENHNKGTDDVRDK